MRWNCPHCGVALAVADDKLGTGWSFSRCFKCGGFGLVRRADINLIKVDKAPTGEKVILPESCEDLRMSQEATKHLTQITQAAKATPAIRPASTRKQQATPPAFKPEMQAAKAENTKNEIAIPSFPEPLPETPERPFRNRILPMAIGLAGFAAISSGVYLYIQGQKLWQEARTAALSQGRSNPIRQTSLTNTQPPAAAATTEVIDTVHHNAMAPIRNDETSKATMVIRATTRASLRSGPGLEFEVLGVANPEARYVVKEWKDRWFHVVLPEAEQNMLPAGKPTTAWIRNDLVEQVSATQ